MTIQEFMKKYSIAVFVIIDQDNNIRMIQSETIQLESNILFEQLITFGDISSITAMADHPILPRTLAQDNTRCLITKNSDFMICVFYRSALNVIEDHHLSLKINADLMHIEMSKEKPPES